MEERVAAEPTGAEVERLLLRLGGGSIYKMPTPISQNEHRMQSAFV